MVWVIDNVTLIDLYLPTLLTTSTELNKEIPVTITVTIKSNSDSPKSISNMLVKTLIVIPTMTNNISTGIERLFVFIHFNLIL